MALRCPVPPLTERLPLFPGRVQRWEVVVHASDEDAAAEKLRIAMQRWQPLVFGRFGEPHVVEPGRGDETAIARAPAQLQMRRGDLLLRVAFAYDGQDESMGWPTFSQRRRERIDPLCPEPPLAAFPLRILTPGDDAGEFDALPPFRAIPPLVGLNPQLPKPADWLATVAPFAAGAGLLYLLWRFRGK